MVTKLRLFAALGALVTALVVASQSAPPAIVGTSNVQLRSTAAPMDPPTTMKSPIVATTDPSPFDPCFKTSYGVIQQSLFYSTVYSSPEVDCPSTNRQRANDLSPYYKF
jgi:hypothetical protein